MIKRMIKKAKRIYTTAKRKAKQLQLSCCYDTNPAVVDCRWAGMCIHIS